MRKVAPMVFVASLVILAGAQLAYADKIVVANDEWQTTNSGFANTPAGSKAFVENVASFFTGGGAGSFLVVSDNFSLDDDLATSFISALTTAGHTIVDSEDIGGFIFDVPTLLGYDGVFVALSPASDQTVLTNYVNAGGNVYVHGGTGVGGAASEAASWNTFLNAFGLGFLPSYNGISGNIPITSSHAVMAGVASLYQNNGNSIVTVGVNPNAQIIATHSLTGAGLYAVYEKDATVPEPASVALLGAGLAGLVWVRRSRRQRR